MPAATAAAVFFATRDDATLTKLMALAIASYAAAL